MKKKLIYLVLGAFAVAAVSCTRDNPEPGPSTEWLSRTDGFESRYTLEQMVVLSRHNIRAPLVGKGSVLTRVASPDCQWFAWEGSPSHLTPKGERLETKMGEFFKQWLDRKGLLDDYTEDIYSFRFYANAKQRCQVTARKFADALLPGKNPRVEMNVEYDTMDPVFHPQITKLPAGFTVKAQEEIAAMMGDLNAGIASQYKLMENVINITASPAYPDTTSFSQFPSSVSFKVNAEPSMSGGLKMACTVSDALVLQYYEEPDEKKAAFGKTLSFKDWTDISAVKDWYGNALFTAPSVAANVAHPLLLTMLSELQNERRAFTFLCGHDSNVGSVLAALEAEPYSLPGAIEQTTPIGCKIVVERFRGADEVEYADVWLVYASAAQLRAETSLSYSQPPMSVRMKFRGLVENEDGLYRLSALEERFNEAIEAYDKL